VRLTSSWLQLSVGSRVTGANYVIDGGRVKTM
jgi:hypothetical protein